MSFAPRWVSGGTQLAGVEEDNLLHLQLKGRRAINVAVGDAISPQDAQLSAVALGGGVSP